MKHQISSSVKTILLIALVILVGKLVLPAQNGFSPIVYVPTGGGSSSSTFYNYGTNGWVGTNVTIYGDDTPLTVLGTAPGSFSQVKIKNTDTTAGSSSDFVAEAPDGNETNRYIDMGFNGPLGGVQPFSNAANAYLYSIPSNNAPHMLNIGALGSNSVITFSTGSPMIGNTAPTNPVERVRISTNGNVGIGTNAPGAPLDVQGNVLIRGSLTLNNSVGFDTVGNAQAISLVLGNNRIYNHGSGTNGFSAGAAGTTPTGTILASNGLFMGSVGIGTNAPTANVEIANAGSAGASLLINGLLYASNSQLRVVDGVGSAPGLSFIGKTSVGIGRVTDSMGFAVGNGTTYSMGVHVRGSQYAFAIGTNGGYGWIRNNQFLNTDVDSFIYSPFPSLIAVTNLLVGTSIATPILYTTNRNVGIGTIAPQATLHINTLSTNTIGLWAASNGTPIIRIETNGLATLFVGATNAIGATGYTNNTQVNQQLFMSFSAVSYTIKDRVGGTAHVSPSGSGQISFILQPGAAVIGTGGASGLTGTATTF